MCVFASHVDVCTCVCEGHRYASAVFPYCSPSYFLGQGLSLKQEITDLTLLADHWVPRNPLSVIPSTDVRWLAPPCCCLSWCSGCALGPYASTASMLPPHHFPSAWFLLNFWYCFHHLLCFKSLQDSEKIDSSLVFPQQTLWLIQPGTCGN